MSEQPKLYTQAELQESLHVVVDRTIQNMREGRIAFPELAALQAQLAAAERQVEELRATCEGLQRQADNAAKVIAQYDCEVEELRRERDQAIAHDRQPYPTAHAYEQVCKALEAHKAELASLRSACQALEQENASLKEQLAYAQADAEEAMNRGDE